MEKTKKRFFAPGRIILIGEHTDYNGGHVFLAAITLGIYGVVRKRQDQSIRLYSENFAEVGIIELILNDLSYKKEDGWTNYSKGMVHYLMNDSYPIDQGMAILFYGMIPNDAGLSSSASIELLTGVMLNDLFDLDIHMLNLVKTGQ
ncbi:hypothetical protein RU98_GL001285 [Enterococcus caccae]|nr:hypothetical protein RU98_GL001285 [Enterococcus caccae]